MLKRLRDELVECNVIGKGRIPSFLVESLVYGVEDHHFLWEDDDRCGRLLRVVRRIQEQLDDPAWVKGATEINGVKFLFHQSQPWTVDVVKQFTLAAWTRLNA